MPAFIRYGELYTGEGNIPPEEVLTIPYWQLMEKYPGATLISHKDEYSYPVRYGEVVHLTPNGFSVDWYNQMIERVLNGNKIYALCCHKEGKHKVYLDAFAASDRYAVLKDNSIYIGNCSSRDDMSTLYDAYVAADKVGVLFTTSTIVLHNAGERPYNQKSIGGSDTWSVVANIDGENILLSSNVFPAPLLEIFYAEGIRCLLFQWAMTASYLCTKDYSEVPLNDVVEAVCSVYQTRHNPIFRTTPDCISNMTLLLGACHSLKISSEDFSFAVAVDGSIFASEIYNNYHKYAISPVAVTPQNVALLTMVNSVFSAFVNHHESEVLSLINSKKKYLSLLCRNQTLNASDIFPVCSSRDIRLFIH